MESIEKDTCKLAFDAIWWEVAAVITIYKNNVHNVIANVTFSLDLQKKAKRNKKSLEKVEKMRWTYSFDRSFKMHKTVEKGI